MREDNIKDYCNGVCRYLVFLKEVISDTKLYGYYIIKNNDNKYTEFDNNSFDYTKLNFSDFNI